MAMISVYMMLMIAKEIQNTNDEKYFRNGRDFYVAKGAFSRDFPRVPAK